MKTAIKVFKFGGASLKDPAAIRHVGTILSEYKEEPIMVVVSAMGKTTNALEEVIKAAANADTDLAVSRLNELRKEHIKTCQALDLPDSSCQEVNRHFDDVQDFLPKVVEHSYDFSYDQIVSLGELAGSRIVAGYFNLKGLPTTWVDARKIIRTDDIYREGWVQWEETDANFGTEVAPIFEGPGFGLTQGFLGSTEEGFTTTLGREGSDYTAAICSYCLDAESMSIWKDVPGVLTADPRLFENVTKLGRLSYKEAIEMTYYGAKVIHPKTIKPLQNKNIPLEVRSFLNPHETGTLITSEVDEIYPAMVAVEKNQAILHISTRDFSFVAEHHLSILFKKIADLRLQVNMMQNNAISFNVVVTDVDNRINDFIENIQNDFIIVVDQGLELVTIRHYTEKDVELLKSGKVILLESRLPKTFQMVLKDTPQLQRKANT